MAKSCLVGCSAAMMMVMGIVMIHTTEAQVGVCYGTLGDNLPTQQEVIALYNQYNIRRMRIYAPNQDALRALAETNIDLILGVLNGQLQDLASSQVNADSWVQTNILNHANVKFRYIAVGNEVHIDNPVAQYLVPAMINVQNALNNVGKRNQIKVSHAVDPTLLNLTVIDERRPPSEGSFLGENDPILTPLIKFLKDNDSPLLINLYPYYTYNFNSDRISLDYALFRSQSVVVTDHSLGYKCLFDAILDAVYAAMEKKGAGSVPIVISETGWPSGGKEVGASPDNAGTYLTNVVEHVKGGTPKKPGVPIETYIFAMFDENLKTPDREKFWGLFQPNKQPKYNINFG